jgi:hypothetical protein
MQKSDKVIISTMTLFTSLFTYWYAKAAEKDAAPYVMIGGFLGSLLGEVIADKVKKDDSKQE